MSQPEGTYLGFDFGTKHIGVAVGQSITGDARPLQSLRVQHRDFDRQLQQLIQTWEPVGLVVGLPLNMDGTTQHITSLAQQFGKRLAHDFGLPVHWHDERLSTRLAREHLFETEGYKGLQKERVDCVSAQCILSSWLQEHGSNDGTTSTATQH